MTALDTGEGLATVVDLQAERRERRPSTDTPLNETQRAVLRRMRQARRRLLTRTS